ncbi:MAG: bifunctional phosphoglucose/phosphomannose isomerase [Candidatus Omnitrophica bacterium]|nr:bifunctional phosphoglucose/phosphomannose isomerase [Candidatus Omnitrophota bacterium]
MTNLDDIKTIEKFDSARMRDIIKGFAGQCSEAFQLGRRLTLPGELRDFKNIVFCGMGGSAIGAEVVSGYLRREIDKPICVNREYTLPAFADQNSLVILNSYSGDTEEILSVYRQAQNKKTKTIIVTSGGQLADLAKKNKDACVLIPKGLPPRTALGFLFFPLLAVFCSMKLIADKSGEVQEAIALLEKLEKQSLGIGVSADINPAKMLAKRVADHFAFIYAGSEYFGSVATRWRSQFAENSKMLSSSNVFPEMNHNEIAGWKHPAGLINKCVVVMLRDSNDHPQIKKRMEISKEIFQQAGVTVKEMWSEGVGLLARIFSLIYKGDYVSFYLSILNDEDPTPIKRIDFLKKRLSDHK